MPVSPASAVAELSATAEAVNGYRRRIGQLAAGFDRGESEDIVSAIYEAERSLEIAERTVRRALRLAAG